MSRALAWVRTEPDRTVGGALVLLGGLLLLLSYLSVDSDPVIVDQLSTLVLGGVGGLLLAGVGAMVLVLSDLADEWHKLDRIEALLGGREEPRRRPGLLGLEAPLRAPLVLGGLGTLAGVVVVLVAWNRATGESDPKDGFSAVALGVGGLVVTATTVLSSTFWFVRVVRLRASRVFAPWLVQDLQARVDAVGARVARARADQVLPSLPRTVLVGAGLRRFHVAGCGVLATGGPYDVVDLASAPPAMAPCGLCLPELANGTASRVLEGATVR